MLEEPGRRAVEGREGLTSTDNVGVIDPTHHYYVSFLFIDLQQATIAVIARNFLTHPKLVDVFFLFIFNARLKTAREKPHNALGYLHSEITGGIKQLQVQWCFPGGPFDMSKWDLVSRQPGTKISAHQGDPLNWFWIKLKVHQIKEHI